MILALGAGGCATKNFVRNSIDPLSNRVGTLETTSKDQAQEIEEVGNSASRANERAMTADQRAEAAAKQAQDAQGRADTANQAAANAREMAQKGLSGVDALGQRIDGLDNYNLAAEKTVLFALESSRLDDQAKAELNEVAGAVRSGKPTVIEIRGFTDTTGSTAYNLALSERRAKEVVRYLAAEHDIPLRQIHMLGFGSEDPAEDNATRDGRQLNRRVEVKVFIADGAAETASNQ
jgi:outer membrane protein OmpA-like peptidoglycan-associated protein